MNARAPRSRPHLTTTCLDALDVVVSYCNDPDRLFVPDVAEELGCTESWTRRVLQTLRHHGLVMRYTVRAVKGAAELTTRPTLRAYVAWLDEQWAAEQRVTHIEVARHFGTGAESASVRLAEMRALGLLEPRWALWPTRAGIARATR